MKRSMCWIVALGLCLLPLAGQAWLIEPEDVLESREALPADVRELLPEELTLEYAYRINAYLYVWTKDAAGNGIALVFARSDGAYSLLVLSAPFGTWNGYEPSLGFSGSGFFTVSYSESYFSFLPWNDGRWALKGGYFYQGFDQPERHIAYYPHAMTETVFENRDDFGRWSIVYGTWTRLIYLNSPEVSALPRTFGDALAMLDTEGWAMVRPSESGGLAPLRAAPSDTGKVLASYYAGTPAEVLDTGKDWRRVNIAGAEGWMPADTLVFGEAMLEVTPGFPDLVLEDEVLEGKKVLYAAPSVESALVEVADPENIENLFIIGVVNDEWYHVMDLWGDQGYIQSKWFSEGNG